MANPRPLPAFCNMALCLACLAIAPPLFAQDEKNPSASPPAKAELKPSTKDANQESDPLRILWLRDSATGELVPVAGLTIEEYDKLDRIRRGLPPEVTAPPSYVLTDLRLIGKANGASMSCELNLEVELRDDRWARIPIGLSRAALRSVPLEENWLVTPDSATDGFVLWAKGNASEKKALKIQFDYPLEATSESTRLQIALPRARSSTAELTIEATEMVFRMEGSGAIDSKKFSAGIGELRCSGFASSLDISWRPKSQPKSTESWFEVFGLIEIRVDGRRQTRADAKLRIRSFGSLNQPLRIRLPKGMRLSPDAAAISPFVRSQSVSQNAEDGVSNSYQTLELTLDAAAPSDFELQVQAESEGSIAANASEMTLDSFEVLSAKRHWGMIDLFLTSDWYASATQLPEIRRIDVEPGVVADPSYSRSRFEYASQGAAIAVTARLPRTLVEPTYDFFVESGQLRLDGQFKYRFRGPSAGAVEIDLADWDLERVSSPDSAFLVDDVQQIGSRLIIPLSPLPPPAGAEASLRVEARRNAEENKAQLRLPVAKTSVETPAIVRVHSDVNLEVTPRSAEFRNISVDPVGGIASSPQQKGQFVYRTRPGLEPPFLVFDVQVRKQALMQSLLTKLTVTGRPIIGVQHEIRLNVSYEPLREVTLDLPASIFANGAVRVMLDDQPLEQVNPVEQDVETSSAPQWTRCRYLLPQAYLGPLKLSIQYSYATPSSSGAPVTMVLPLPKLIVASPIQSKPHELVLHDPAHIVEIVSSDWSRELFDAMDRAADLGDHFSSLKPMSEVNLKLSELVASPQRNNRCEKWWLQTILGDGTRNDRLCLRMNSWTTPLRLRLPQGLVVSSVIAAVDGVQVSQGRIADREITLANPRANAAKAQVIEIWYQCQSKPLQWGSASLDAPAILDLSIADRVYWQLLTAADWYSLLRPTNWTMEQSSTLQDFWRGKSTGLQQIDLERWVGATSQPPPPSQFNHYLFSAMSPTSGLSLVLAPRRDLWLIVLGATFAVSMLYVHLASLRTPMGLIVLATAAAFVVVFEPHWSGGLVQLVVVGLAATLVVGLMRMMLVPPRHAILRNTPSRNSARSLDTAMHLSESVVATRRGSSISNSPVAAGPTP